MKVKEAQGYPKNRQVLYVTDLAKAIRAESENNPGDDGRDPVFCQMENEQINSETTQDISQELNKVISQNRVPGYQTDRKGDQAEHDHMFWEGEGIFKGEENIRIEKMERIREQLVGIPGKYPGIQERIDRRYQVIGHLKGQWPQHDDGQHDKEQ